MSGVIEGTIEALVEFEAALDGIKSEASEAKKQMVRSAGDLAASAKSNALARARDIAAQRLEEARRDADREAREIRLKGDAEMRKFEVAVSRRKKEAAELVASRLLGEKR